MAYTQYSHAKNLPGSNKAPSYLRALDLLEEMLKTKTLGFEDCQNIWEVESIDRLEELYTFVTNEKNKGDKSAWNLPGIPKSYLQNGYCSAALRDYQKFLVIHRHEHNLMNTFLEHAGDESEIASKLDKAIQHPEYLIEDYLATEGKDVVRIVNTRVNQGVFRKIILHIYNQTCCISGIDIPAINRASHIIPWADEKAIRMDPCNGLCLSATYDAAFDRHLISLDYDYRVIISKDIKEHYTNESVKRYFLSKEGERISLPDKYLPQQEYLEKHRGAGEF